MIERQTRPTINTLHVNLWGSPGMGKSPVSAVLYGKLKEAGFEATLVQDYAAELSLQGKLEWRDVDTGQTREFDQFLISAEQYRRQSEMEGLVEVIITHSPLLQQLVFAPENYYSQLQHVINELTIGWTSMDVLLAGDIRSDYSSMGRIKSSEQSVALQPEILEILKSDRPDFITMPTEGSAQRLFEIVVDKLQRQRAFSASL